VLQAFLFVFDVEGSTGIIVRDGGRHRDGKCDVVTIAMMRERSLQ